MLPGQYDDHCWITFEGEGWAILGIQGDIWHLWRGYFPDLEFKVIKVGRVDWSAYATAAAARLKVS